MNVETGLQLIILMMISLCFSVSMEENRMLTVAFASEYEFVFFEIQFSNYDIVKK